MNMQIDPKTLIERPDGSLIAFEKLEPAKQLEHEVVMRLCTEAEIKSQELHDLKHRALGEMIAARVMMFEDFGVKKGGKDGNLTLRSSCGRYMARMTVSKHVTFGPELEAAKALIFEVVEDELEKGSSTFIHDLVTRVFSPNKRGRIDTQGILNLREVECDDPRWARAMEAIEQAILRDSSTTYVNFYQVDPKANSKETRIPLSLAEV